MSRPRLLVLGTGFGAYSFLRQIDQRAYDVTVISPRNHFVFTPLLPSTAVGTVEFRSVIEPIRPCCSNARFLLGRASHLNLAEQIASCQSSVGEVSWDQPFDVLVLAVGCVTNTFGVPGVEEHGYILKEVDDARRIRQSLVANLERASLPGLDSDEQSRLLHLVAVGGGPTGVRFAGELFDLITRDLPRSYPHLAGKLRITVLDAGSTVLSAYDHTLREYVQAEFVRRGLDIRTGIRIQAVEEAGIRLPDGELLPCGMVLWSAGFARNPLVADLPFEKDKSGRLLTDEFLRLPGSREIYALGDCACPRGQTLPQLAQVANQQGRYLASSFNALSKGQTVRPFAWRPRQISSFIGGGAAVAGSGESSHQLSGFWAYQQWRVSTWSQLASWRAKIVVPLDRLRAFAFGRDVSRL